MHHLKTFLLLAPLVLWFVGPVCAAGVTATGSIGDPVQVSGVAQQDLDGDGAPDVAAIDCVFATEHDQVLVFDENGDMVRGSQWDEVTDFQDDVWVFDAGADGSAQLIVDFEVEDERYAALIYDDLNGDGQVRYGIEGDQIMIEESRFWHVKVESEHTWVQQNYQFDTNLTVLVDGYDGLGQGVGNPLGTEDIGIDGVVDWQLQIGDHDDDGVIDYQLQRATSPILVEYSSPGFHKAVILAQVAGRQPSRYSSTVFWPLLVGKHPYADYRYFDHPPVIAVDWEAGIIDRIGVLGYPIEAGYHVFDRLPLEMNTINAANWENPMAYYDMANDQDGWPELQIRFAVAVPYDPYFPYPYQGEIETPNLEVNYSWDQDNDNRWDYKMNLSANYPIDELTDYPDFALKSVPYDEIIPWTKQHTWDVAMLIFDGHPTRDSEGMFGRGWMIHRGYADGARIEPSGVHDRYLMGFGNRPPTENYQDIQEGMRGEYSFRYFDRPKMYLSTLDRQLHLSSAQAGVWNLGEGHYLRYANLDGDTYLDQWQDEREGIVVQQLNYDHGVFVYSGSGVRLKQSDLGHALFETQPPGNYDEWQRLVAQLNDHQVALSPEDFTGMLDQLPGSEIEIRRALVRNYRNTQQGFRFILELQPGFSVHGDQEDLLPLPKAPGTYVVDYDGNAWSVRTATPSSLRIDDVLVRPQIGKLRAQRWTTVGAVLRNDGLEDVHDLSVCAILRDPAGRQVVMTDTVALLPGEGQQWMVWDWAPSLAGSWRVQMAIDCDYTAEDMSSGGKTLADSTLEVLPGADPSPTRLISLGNMVSLPLVVLLLVAAVAMAGAVAAVWIRTSGS